MRPTPVSVRDIVFRTAAPETEFSPTFIGGMLNRMAVSFFKYGALRNAYPHDVDAIASLKVRLAKYEEDGNVEWLMDVANFAMIEFMHPRHPDAHYEPQDSDTSPGRVDNRGKNRTDPNGARTWW